MANVFKALSDPTRRKVLELLRGGSKTAGELSEHFDVSKPTMSVHFKVLREADLVRAEREGKHIVYSLKMSVLEEALMGFAQAFQLEVRREQPNGEEKVHATAAEEKGESTP